MKPGFWKDFYNFVARRKVAPSVKAGTFGYQIYGGYLVSQEKSPALSGLQRYITYSELLANSTIVAAAVRFFLELVSKASWKMEGDDEETAEFMEDVLYNMDTTWKDVVKRAAMYRFYGYSWQEWTAETRDEDGRIGLLDVEERPQSTIERWDVDLKSGQILGVAQRSPQTGQELYIPRAKSVYLVDRSIASTPEGLGLLRHAVEPARQLARLEQVEGWGYELDLRGIPFGRAPLEDLQRLVDAGMLSPQQRDALLEPLQQFILHHIKNPESGVLLDSSMYTSPDGTPSGNPRWGMELASGGGTAEAAAACGVAIQRKTRELARVFGLEGLLLGESGAGSLAMSRDKSQNFFLIASSSLDGIVEAMARDLVAPVMTLNGIPKERWPYPKPDAIQHRDVEEITSSLERMSRAGATLTPDDPAIEDVRNLLGLRLPDKESLALAAMLQQPQQVGQNVGAPAGEPAVPTAEKSQPTSSDVGAGGYKRRSRRRRTRARRYAY